MSIGELARVAGLSVSAVRFYADRGLLPPAEVDPATGYRSYDERQIADAVLIRDLRRLGMGLAEVAVFLATSVTERRSLVEEHLLGMERALADARSVAHGLHVSPNRPEKPMNLMTVAANDLARALDQVLPAASADTELPVLTCVLVEGKDGSLRLVATDSFRLVIRDLAPTAGVDASFRALVPAATLHRWRTDLPGHGQVTVGVDHDRFVLDGDGVELHHTLVDATYPAYEALLTREDQAGQIVVARVGLLVALDAFAEQGDAVLIHAAGDELTIVRREESVSLPARCDGPGIDVAFDPAFAAEAVRAAVGAEVVIEVVDAGRPVVFRSADDGTYTALLMPVLLS